MQFHRYAAGLHEPLSLAERDGSIYAVQRGEATRMTDDDGDGRADRIETLSDGWGISGDQHEYAFGSKFDKQGDLWVTLCLTGSSRSAVPFRGWCLRIHPDGSVTPTCSGIRSPGGMGANLAGDMFYTDNQGPWNGACTLRHLKPGGFMGSPSGNRWYDLAKNLGPKPTTPKSGSRIAIEEKRIKELVPPAILLPYDKMGKSASGVVVDSTDGNFGPFAGQMFVGDQSQSIVMRVFLEKIDGVYQGACFPFREGFASGTLGLEFSPSGAMFVGGTNRGWPSRGTKEYALERLNWTGKTPFETREMRIERDGFSLAFTAPVDRATAEDEKSYALQTYTYIYQSSYGSPEVDQTKPTIKKIEVADDGLTVRLAIDGLQLGHVHELHMDGLRSTDGRPLLHAEAYYTLNRLPKE
jgi:hypothetical protein